MRFLSFTFGVLLALDWPMLSSPTVCQTPATDTHWSFQPVKRPQIPQVRGRANTDVDRFILAAQEAKGLQLSPEADRLTLIRRVSFDLTGLPPKLAEIDAF